MTTTEVFPAPSSKLWHDAHIVSWNLLTPAYCSADQLPHNASESTDNEWRWSAIEKRLTGLFRQCAIMCLQEVSNEWAGRLQVLCALHNMECVVRLYGQAHSDYMGVAILYARNTYVADRIDRIRPTDLVTWPKKPPSSYSLPPAASNLYMAGGYGHQLWRWASGAAEKDRLALEQWQHVREVQQRMNTVLRVRLRPRTSARLSASFTVATYHMPCDFKHVDRMLMHTLLASKAALSDLPSDHAVVFAGDFNTLPGSVPYNIMASPDSSSFCIMYTESSSNPFYQQVIGQMRLPQEWKSAYYEASGEERVTRQQTTPIRDRSEPAATTRAHSHRFKEPFEGTLDYVWVRNAEVRGVAPLAKLNCLLPSVLGEEPSDHLMLHATVRIKK